MSFTVVDKRQVELRSPPFWRIGSPAANKPHLLFIHWATPKPDMDSGSVDTYNYMKVFRELGFEVTFFGWFFPIHEGRYTEALEAMGIQCLYTPNIQNLAEWLQAFGRNLSMVFIAGVSSASACLAEIKAHVPYAKIFFFTQDLHFLREQRQAQVLNSEEAASRAVDLKQRELEIIASSDATIVVSPIEEQILAELAPKAEVYLIPVFRDIPGRSATFSDRRDIVFVGWFRHDPNVDAMIYFLREVWPLVRGKIPGVRLNIVGSDMPPRLAGLVSEGVVVHGHVADLDDIFGRCRISIAPLRYGAGQKGKVVTSLSYGVPVIATSVAIEGMHLHDESVVRVGDTPESFAEAVADVYLHEAEWQRISNSGLAHATAHFGYDVGKRAIERMICDVLGTDAATHAAFIAAAAAIVEEENRSPHFPALPQMSRPLVVRLVKAAREAVLPRSGSAFDLLLHSMKFQEHWILAVAAGCLALEDGRREQAQGLSEFGMSQMPSDLYTQELWLRSRTAQGDAYLARIDEDLRGRFCDRPFKWLEFTGNASWVCCSAWLPVPIGAAPVKPDDMWNGPVSQELRRSILDGSFRYCSRVHCPWIVKEALPKRDETDLTPYAPVMPAQPVYLNLCYDESCNLSCPSCRREVMVADKERQAKLDVFYEIAVAPLLSAAQTVNITGSGDPFASHHFRRILRQIAQSGGPSIDLQTNGVLVDERAWTELGLKNCVRRIWVSLDATSKSIYDAVRRKGSLEHAKDNIRAMVQRRRAGRIAFIGIDFVVQNTNLDEMLDFISLGIELGVDSVRFSMVRNWGTFTTEEFAEHFVGSPAHPRYPKLMAILSDPLFSNPIVDPGNLWRFGGSEWAYRSSVDHDVMHT
jgi:glycosyltransferase involved in cell wall biosynthesis